MLNHSILFFVIFGIIKSQAQISEEMVTVNRISRIRDAVLVSSHVTIDGKVVVADGVNNLLHTS